MEAHGGLSPSPIPTPVTCSNDSSYTSSPSNPQEAETRPLTREKEFAFHDGKLAEKIIQQQQGGADPLDVNFSSLVDQLRSSIGKSPRYLSPHEMALSRECRLPGGGPTSFTSKFWVVALLLALAVNLPSYILSAQTDIFKIAESGCLDIGDIVSKAYQPDPPKPGSVQYANTSCLFASQAVQTQPASEAVLQGVTGWFESQGHSAACINYTTIVALRGPRATQDSVGIQAQPPFFQCLGLAHATEQQVARHYYDTVVRDTDAEHRVLVYYGVAWGLSVLVYLVVAWGAYLNRRHTVMAARGSAFLRMLALTSTSTLLSAGFLTLSRLGLITGDDLFYVLTARGPLAVYYGAVLWASLSLVLLYGTVLCQQRALLGFHLRKLYTGRVAEFLSPLLVGCVVLWVLMVMIPQAVALWHPMSDILPASVLALCLGLGMASVFFYLVWQLRATMSLYTDSYQNVRLVLLTLPVAVAVFVLAMEDEYSSWVFFALPYGMQCSVLFYNLDVLLGRLLWVAIKGPAHPTGPRTFSQTLSGGPSVGRASMAMHQDPRIMFDIMVL